MKIIIRRLTLSDLLINIYYKIKYFFIISFLNDALFNRSELEKKGYKVTFNDDFEKIDCSYDGKNTKWKVGEPWGLFHESYPLSYFSPIEKIYDGTKALFTVKYDPKEFNHPVTNEKIVIPFSTTKISSHLSFKQKYGRIECRCTLPEEVGSWPAFWMWGESWPPEIDIFEVYGGKKGKTGNIQEINLHYGSNEDGTKTQMTPWKIKIDDLKFINIIFHEYAVEWTPKKIEFFIDGIKVFRYSRKDILDKYFNTDNVNMGIIINNGIDEKFVDKNNKNYYSSFLVDYVRAYQIL